MKNKLLIPVIVIAIIIAIVVIKNNTTNNNHDNNRPMVAEQERKIAFSKEKQFNGLKIVNGTITTDINGKAQFTADVRNDSNEVKEEQRVKLRLLDRSGKALQEIDTTIKKMNVNETIKLNVEFKTEYSLNIYNYEIVKK